jgi:nucleoside-diphosphate-sugar epimerase
MSLKGARVLLTGGTGFIGSRLAAALDAEGCDLRLLVRATSDGVRLGPLWNRLQRVTADLSSPSALAAAVKAADPEYVFHLAKERQGATFEREARATTALAAALAANAPRLKRWVRTAHAASENLGRGADAELARSLAARFKLPVATLELFLVYGPGQNAGDFPRDLAEAALSGAPVSAPAEAKDLVFVDDVAAAYLAAARSAKAAGAWISVGGGRLVSGAEAAGAALQASDRGAEEALHAPAPRSAGHPADLRLAKELLGWTPATSLENGMRHLTEWLKAGAETGHG